MKILILHFLILSLSSVYGKTIKESILIQSNFDKKSNSKLELIKLTSTENINSKYIILYIPGYFQNAESFDLLPKEKISVARYMQELLPHESFLLNPNGIGRSKYLKRSTLDDIALHDIASSVDYLKSKYPQKKLILFSHSMGAITSKAYLGGITKCTKRSHCFDPQIAKKRQDKIHVAIFSAGNVCVTNDKPGNIIQILTKAIFPAVPVVKRMGFLPTKLFNKILFPVNRKGKKNVITHNLFWKFLYNPKNVSSKARNAIYNKTVEGVSAPTMAQFYYGAKDGCLHTEKRYESYQKGLSYIELPIFQMLYTLDGLAPPEETIRDDFSYIATPQSKKFLRIYQNQGHEDFMMSRKFHKNLNPLRNFILRQN
ncbi:lysophospholipase [Bacteriovoracaceae bacterium]|nr:lysophospholipase [Bacteriovoracaceae bacterium]